ncbi:MULTISPECIES: hypothetical protein [Methylobacterium]|jgi:hypothetical protein|uniref:Uncharacterized protein n=1 Tax=Methylobacterium tardum TaxID=374432 RepID=A0AA37THN4_9HYPH|nr:MULTISPECIES: hypothetical protein [Methylobacterium]MBP1182688.1 hypothetical protein [Methylobacterium sp. PvR107]URD37080.1 hypothetical protein M6G65_00140 [Methylobacterium tardum]GJE47547.1 hypothetical protein GOFOIKOB_0572 [Methylobacterium tardum]GLS71074.1 hypothetical protein GCM10007890_30870 [Methylobacterium tardum]
MPEPDVQYRPLTPAEEARRRKRSVAIALALGAWVLLFFVLTIVKLGPQILSRPL